MWKGSHTAHTAWLLKQRRSKETHRGANTNTLVISLIEIVVAFIYLFKSFQEGGGLLVLLCRSGYGFHLRLRCRLLPADVRRPGGHGVCLLQEVCERGSFFDFFFWSFLLSPLPHVRGGGGNTVFLSRNKDKLFPKIPQPHNLLSGISDSYFKVKPTTTTKNCFLIYMN